MRIGSTADDIRVVASSLGEVWLIDAATGERIKSFPTGRPIVDLEILPDYARALVVTEHQWQDNVPSTEITVLQTHISWVVLTGPFAYKIKKPVNLGFVDFSTLAQRRFFCQEELRLNRRLAPQLYLDVVAISGTPERPRLHGQQRRAPATS